MLLLQVHLARTASAHVGPADPVRPEYVVDLSQVLVESKVVLSAVFATPLPLRTLLELLLDNGVLLKLDARGPCASHAGIDFQRIRRHGRSPLSCQLQQPARRT